MKKISKIVIILTLAISIAVLNETLASENDPYAYKEIKAKLASEKNHLHFSKILSMLSYLLSEQKRVFTKNLGTGKNEIARQIEEILNEAALYGSQLDYDKAYKSLDNAHEMIMGSLNKMLDEAK